MTIDPATLLAILAMAGATYATRSAGLAIGGRIPRTGRTRAAFDALPAAVLVAVIAPAAVAGPAEVIATAITAAAATRLPLLAVVGSGVAAVVVLRAALG